MSDPSRAEVIARAASRLAGAGVPDPGRDARLLYRWASGMDGAALTAGLSDPAAPAEIARFDRAVDERMSRVPVAQITGRRAFWGRDFIVTPDVLDPRPETETLVALALQGPAPVRMLDLGTGTGCLLLTLLAEWPQATGIGIDVSTAALDVARRNAAALNLADRAELRHGDWLDGIDGQFDVVISNPPYIRESGIPGLAPEVRDHEPRMALTPGGDGLGAYRAMAAGLARVLAPGGRFFAEIGAGQADDVAAIFGGHGHMTGQHRDFDGRVRCISVTGQIISPQFGDSSCPERKTGYIGRVSGRQRSGE